MKFPYLLFALVIPLFYLVAGQSDEPCEDVGGVCKSSEDENCASQEVLPGYCANANATCCKELPKKCEDMNGFCTEEPNEPCPGETLPYLCDLDNICCKKMDIDE